MPIPASDGSSEKPGIELVVGATVAPGEEERFCKLFVVPDEGYRVRGFRHRLESPITHHALLVPTPWSAQDVSDRAGEALRRCDVAHESGGSTRLLHGAQPGLADVTFPEGVAMAIPPASVMLLEHHVVNTQSAALYAEAIVELLPFEGELRAEAGILHYYHWAIRLPERGEGRARMHCRVPESLTLVYGHGHTHARGTRFRAWTSNRGEADPFLDTPGGTDATRSFDPPVHLDAGEAVEIECEYRNPDDRVVTQGVSARDDEMCSFTAGYFTDSGARLDALDELCTVVGSGVVGGGSRGCSAIGACLREAAARDFAEFPQTNQGCWAEGCAESTIPYLDLALCRAERCGAPCAVDPSTFGALAWTELDAACVECQARECGAAVAACNDSPCGP